MRLYSSALALVCRLSRAEIKYLSFTFPKNPFTLISIFGVPDRGVSTFSKKLKGLKIQKVMADIKYKDILQPLQTAVKLKVKSFWKINSFFTHYFFHTPINIPYLISKTSSKGDEVRGLKESKAPENDIKAALKELKAAKKILEDKVLIRTVFMNISSNFFCHLHKFSSFTRIFHQILELEDAEGDGPIDRLKLEDLLKQKFFYDQSAAIYGGTAGFFDFGPMGCAMKTNFLAEWRRFFIEEEEMLEVDTNILTPEPVLKLETFVTLHFVKLKSFSILLCQK